jgi:HTH-type transcriptional regulator/antitoxin HigA
MNSAQENTIELTAVPHPGENVVEYLEFNEWSQSDLARRTGLTPKTISEICNGKTPVTTATALAFERAFQRPARFWLSLQRQFDEAEARSREMLKSSSWKEWAELFPLREMRRLDFSLPTGASDTDSLLNFFGVSSPDSWTAVWNAAAVNYRQTRIHQPRQEAVSAWVRETEIIARGLEVAPFSEGRLLSSLGQLRHLSRIGADQIMEPVQEICASCGVAVVWVPELKNTSISGCARWLSDKRALVGLTLRFKTDDQLWFTLFHELGHILLHRGKKLFVIDNAAEDLSDRVIDPEMQQFEARSAERVRPVCASQRLY